jgi:hypothetical protein
MNSKRGSEKIVHNVKLTLEKVTYLYSTEGVPVAVNVTSRVWIGDTPSGPHEVTMSADVDIANFGVALSDIILEKIIKKHEQ